MINNTYPIKLEHSLEYARLVTYIQEDVPGSMIKKRPLVLVCPGGGYSYTSAREAEVVALRFLAMGCHAAVLYYSCAPAVFPASLLELAYSVKLLRANAGEWHIHPDKMIVLGFSAGGHLAASLGMFWNREFVWKGLGLKEEERELLRPNGMILGYPVITSGEFAHKGSFCQILGLDQDPEPETFDLQGKVYSVDEMMQMLSLENQVTKDTPKAFIWHTFEDGGVPMENSLFLVGAMRKQEIPVEYHLFPRGPHGLSLANEETSESLDSAVYVKECQIWIELAKAWIANL